MIEIEYVIDFVLYLLILFLFSILFDYHNEKFNVGWVICIFILYKYLLESNGNYLIPAGVFAIVGAITNHDRKDKEKGEE